MPKPGDWYSRHPWYRRIALSVVAGVLTVPLAAVILGVQLGGFYDLDPTRETLLVLIGAMCAVALFGFGITMFMFEVWWRRHQPWWMLDDKPEDSVHEPDVRE